MAEHPIEGLMDTAMSSIKSMIDVNTIVGDPVTTPDGTVIIPISTVSFGFGAGGSEFGGKKKSITQDENTPMFGGGCGGGANVKPVAFMIVGNGNIKLLPANPDPTPGDRLTALIPEIFDKVNCVISSVSDKMAKKKKEKSEKEEDKKVDVSENI